MTKEIQELQEKKPAYEEEIKKLKDLIYHFMKQVIIIRVL